MILANTDKKSECAEKLIYDQGLVFAKEGAVDEMLGKYPRALRKYKDAYRLFEQLSLEEGLQDADKAILQKCMFSSPLIRGC